MSLKTKIEELSGENSSPSVSIALNTHRTRPNYDLDVIALKNLIKDAESKLRTDFPKKEVESIMEKLNAIANEMDKSRHLDSLHIFVSDTVKEAITVNETISKNYVHVGKRFSIRPLMKAFLASQNYLVLVLGQGGVQLYEALNDELLHEVKNDDFPFSENPHYTTDHLKRSDTKQLDNLVREYFNKVDKAVTRVYHEELLSIIVVSTEGNYKFLMEVADNPSIYKAHVPINYNETGSSQLGKQAWAAMEDLSFIREEQAVQQVDEAVSQGRILTDLQEIYRAAMDGNARRLFVRKGFQQAVVMTDKRSFDYAGTAQEHDVDDIVDEIAWHVFSTGGEILFTSSDRVLRIANVILETRY